MQVNRTTDGFTADFTTREFQVLVGFLGIIEHDRTANQQVNDEGYNLYDKLADALEDAGLPSGAIANGITTAELSPELAQLEQLVSIVLSDCGTTTVVDEQTAQSA